MSGAQSSVEIAGEDSRHTINRSRWRATTTAPPAAIGKGGGLRVEVEKTKLAGRARLGGSACAVQQQRYLPRSQYGRRRPEPAAAPKPRARQHIDGEDTGQQLSPCNFRRRRRTRLSCINRTPGERQQSRLRRLGLLRAPSRDRSNRGTQMVSVREHARIPHHRNARRRHKGGKPSGSRERTQRRRPGRD